MKKMRREAMTRQRKMKATTPMATHALTVSSRSDVGQPASPWQAPRRGGEGHE